MTNEERVAALENLVYTPREAAFLCLAALHAGYFLRRQYAAFMGKELGGTATALVEKLLSQNHGVAISALNHTKIYHLGHRPFYTLLGETDNRNRRHHSEPAMKKRLMGLDFVLAHLDRRYLATEREKLDYFSGTLGIALSELPSKRYVSQKTPSTTTRYFVDKYPIFLAETRANQPRLAASFCFVDEGSLTLSGFETYLQQYATLCGRLKEFHLIFVADSRRLFVIAERRFRAFVSHLKAPGIDPHAQLAARLVAHFEARFQYENGNYGSFSREKLIRLRNESGEFSSAKYQDLYERWKTAGAKSVAQALAPNSALPAPLNATFSTYFVDQNYDFFGRSERPVFAVR